MSLYTLTKADGANPLFEGDIETGITSYVEEVILGLAWEELVVTGSGSAIGKAKKWMDRKTREAKGETNPSDLDAGALFFVEGDKPTKYIGFDNFDPFKDEATQREKLSATHSGDNQSGAGDGDDEQIKLKLRDIPKRFVKIMLVVGAYKPGSDITKATNIKSTVYDGTGGTPSGVAQIEPSLLEDKDILGIAVLERVKDSDGKYTDLWTLTVSEAAFNITKGDMRSLLRQAMNAMRSGA